MNPMEHLNKKKVTNHLRHDSQQVDTLWNDIYQDFRKIHYKFLSQTEYEITELFGDIRLQFEDNFISIQMEKSLTHHTFVCKIHTHTPKLDTDLRFCLSVPLISNDDSIDSLKIICEESKLQEVYIYSLTQEENLENQDEKIQLPDNTYIFKRKVEERNQNSIREFALDSNGSKEFEIYLRRIIYVSIGEVEADMYVTLNKRKNTYKTAERLEEIKKSAQERTQDLRVNFPEHNSSLNHSIPVADSDSTVL